MKTSTSRIEMFKPSRARENVILLDSLEFIMPREQLHSITELHNDGVSIEDISKEVHRDIYEVIIALLHQAKTGKVPLRPFAFRN